MLQERIFKIGDDKDFNKLCLEAFRFQSKKVPVYKSFIGQLGINPSTIEIYNQIPFLPISFFKTKKILADDQDEIMVFSSSGTTGAMTGKHFLPDIKLYMNSFVTSFKLFYGDPREYHILALLPTYLEREGSSLVFMVKELIELSKSSESGFYLNNLDELAGKLEKLQEGKKKVLLIGVTYALLDLAENFPMRLSNTIVMETGGMKGRRKEITREELHGTLKDKLGIKNVHSEYGMTELLSQCYSKGGGIFRSPPWMKIMIREINDPFHVMCHSASGGINIIDLANIYSCSFIETQDLGKLHGDGSFEVTGRFDNSDTRGCNLLVT
jgi:phenylacetate-coenzyme A ligase PaaK-like adenylate-forming protein